MVKKVKVELVDESKISLKKIDKQGLNYIYVGIKGNNKFIVIREYGTRSELFPLFYHTISFSGLTLIRNLGGNSLVEIQEHYTFEKIYGFDSSQAAMAFYFEPIGYTPKVTIKEVDLSSRVPCTSLLIKNESEFLKFFDVNHNNSDPYAKCTSKNKGAWPNNFTVTVSTPPSSIHDKPVRVDNLNIRHNESFDPKKS